MSSAKPVSLHTIRTLPEGNGNRLMKTRCPICDTKYSYWEEMGDPGCEQCAINAVKETKKAQKK